MHGVQVDPLALLAMQATISLLMFCIQADGVNLATPIPILTSVPMPVLPASIQQALKPAPLLQVALVILAITDPIPYPYVRFAPWAHPTAQVSRINPHLVGLIVTS